MNKILSKYTILVFISLSITVFLASVFASGKQETQSKNLIYVSIPPLTYVTQQIVGDSFVVKSLVKEGTNAENYTPTLSQLQELQNAVAYIHIALPFEEKLIKTVKEKNAFIYIKEAGHSIQRVEEIGHHHEEDEDEDHDEEMEEVEGNPHIWMGISNMMILAKDILDSVQEIDNSQSEKYTQNYEDFIALLENTKKEVENTLKPYANRSFLIYHPVLDYFAIEFNLEQIVVQQEGREGSLQQMKEIQDRAKETGAKIIFIQKGFPNSSANTLASQLNLQVEEINPLDEDWINEILALTTKLKIAYQE